MILVLLACAEPDDTGKRPVRDDTGETAGGDSGGDSGDSGESGDSGGDTGEPAPTGLDDLLAALRDDLHGTLLAVSRDTGWPTPVDGGMLFVYQTNGDFSLAGDFSGWSPVATTCGSGFCWAVADASPGDGYKFTAGATWNPDPWSRAFTYDEYGELSLVVPRGEAHLERQFEVSGQGLQARTLHIWVPAGAVDHVLYAEDGQNLFDPGAIWGGWHLQDAAPAGMLVVGIENTSDRMEEYTHVQDFIYGEWYGGWGDTYADYLQDDVRPLIDRVYGESGPVGLLGSSLGGLISLHIADRYPGEYTFAASMSGTIGWGSIGVDNETIIDRYRGAGHRDTALYLDSGGGGDCFDADGDGIDDDDPSGADNYCETVQLRDLLAAEGYEYEVDLWHWWEPDAEHDELAWADRVWRPLEIFAAL